MSKLSNEDDDLAMGRRLMAIRVGGDSGPGAIPGKLDDSSIWTKIEDGSMPPPKKWKSTVSELPPR